MIRVVTDRSKPDSVCFERALRAIKDGQLPPGVAERVWGGLGSGLPCSLCGQPIHSSDIEIELDGVGTAAAVRFHSRCHHLWQQACARVSAEADH